MEAGGDREPGAGRGNLLVGSTIAHHGTWALAGVIKPNGFIDGL